MTNDDKKSPSQELQFQSASSGIYQSTVDTGISMEYRPDTPPDNSERNLTSYPAAGFWIRLLAFTIDILVITGLNSLIFNSVLSIQPGTSLFDKLISINSLFLGITGSLYFILMTHYFQQTLGKMILGIKVVQRNGQPLSWITVVFRELVARSLSHFWGLNLGYMVCWFNSEKRCAHDYLSDTWVVYEKPELRHSVLIASEGKG